MENQAFFAALIAGTNKLVQQQMANDFKYKQTKIEVNVN
jgi:hypothetical protein